MTEIAPRPSFKAKVTDRPQIDKIIFYHQWKHKISKQKKWNSMREKQDHIDVQLSATHSPPHMKHTHFCANTHFVHMCTTPPPPQRPPVLLRTCHWVYYHAPWVTPDQCSMAPEKTCGLLTLSQTKKNTNSKGKWGGKTKVAYPAWNSVQLCLSRWLLLKGNEQTNEQRE